MCYPKVPDKGFDSSVFEPRTFEQQSELIFELLTAKLLLLFRKYKELKYNRKKSWNITEFCKYLAETFPLYDKSFKTLLS